MTEKIPVKDGLQIDERRSFARADWRAQRIGWAAMAVVIAVALAGGLGRGRLAHRTIAVGAADTVHYERIARHQAAERLQVVLSPRPADTVAIEFGQAWLDSQEITDIEPRPERTEAVLGGARYVFARTGSGTSYVTFTYRPNGYGRVPSWVRIDGGTAAPFSQFVLP